MQRTTPSSSNLSETLQTFVALQTAVATPEKGMNSEDTALKREICLKPAQKNPTLAS